MAEAEALNANGDDVGEWISPSGGVGICVGKECAVPSEDLRVRVPTFLSGPRRIFLIATLAGINRLGESLRASKMAPHQPAAAVWHLVNSVSVPNTVNRWSSSSLSSLPNTRARHTRLLSDNPCTKITIGYGRMSPTQPTKPKLFEHWLRFWPIGMAGHLSRVWNARTPSYASRFWTA
jgi:hypothetical protein